MTTLKLKRRNSGTALTSGVAPLTTGAGGVQSGEAIWDNIANILYLGGGDDGAGNATSIRVVGGTGAFVPFNLVGAASGIATLNASGQVPAAQLPASITGAMTYQGTWNAATNTPALVSGSGTKGAFYKVSVAGTTAIDGNSTWYVGDVIAFDGTTWDKIAGPAEAVTSVAGRIGAVTLTTADIAGLSSFAPLASPALSGTPTAPTAASGTNTTQLATTAFVQAAVTAAAAPSVIDGGAI